MVVPYLLLAHDTHLCEFIQANVSCFLSAENSLREPRLNPRLRMEQIFKVSPPCDDVSPGFFQFLDDVFDGFFPMDFCMVFFSGWILETGRMFDDC